jgi:hypothetical protein
VFRSLVGGAKFRHSYILLPGGFLCLRLADPHPEKFSAARVIAAPPRVTAGPGNGRHVDELAQKFAICV